MLKALPSKVSPLLGNCKQQWWELKWQPLTQQV